METEEEHFNRSLPVQIRFNDIDAIGHINNNIYYSFYDLGKIHYLDCLKAESVSWTEGQIVLARIESDFLLPIFYKENIAVDTKIIRLGNKSGTFLQQLRNVDTDEVKSICKSVFVTFDASAGKSIEIPSEWKAAISQFEQASF
ncbi:MAG: acyl-CoA thioesterase [Dysgonomonas sp.]